MIIIDKNWDNTPFKLHKDIIVHDLFDKVASMIETQDGKIINKENLDLYVHTWFKSFCANLTFSGKMTT